MATINDWRREQGKRIEEREGRRDPNATVPWPGAPKGARRAEYSAPITQTFGERTLPTHPEDEPEDTSTPLPPRADGFAARKAVYLSWGFSDAEADRLAQ